MASHGDSTGSGDGASRNNPVKGAEGKTDAKGKERETTIIDRLHASGRMALNAAVVARPSLAGSSSGKPATGAASATQNGPSVSESALSESSRSHGSLGLGEALRGHSHASGEASAQYDQFLNSEPHMQDLIQSGFQNSQPVPSQSFREQAESDGADVIQLLSMPEQEPNYSDFDELLSEQEAARLREALFANGALQPRWDPMLNFSPDFIMDPTRSQEAKSLMGTEDGTVARDLWLKQWQTVLGSYTDEVWGDLGSLVKEAREEIGTMVSHTDTRSPESKALDRLRQILAHVRGQV